MAAGKRRAEKQSSASRLTNTAAHGASVAASSVKPRSNATFDHGGEEEDWLCRLEERLASLRPPRQGRRIGPAAGRLQRSASDVALGARNRSDVHDYPLTEEELQHSQACLRDLEPVFASSQSATQKRLASLRCQLDELRQRVESARIDDSISIAARRQQARLIDERLQAAIGSERSARRETENALVDQLVAHTAELRIAALPAKGDDLRKRLIEKDLPGVRDLLQEMVAKRTTADQRVVERISHCVRGLRQSLAAEVRAREASEQALLQACTEIAAQLAAEVAEERQAREASEQKLLNELESAKQLLYDTVLRRRRFLTSPSRSTACAPENSPLDRARKAR